MFISYFTSISCNFHSLISSLFNILSAWTLFKLCSGQLSEFILSVNQGYYTEPNTNYIDSYCVPDDSQYVFTIYDSFYDGICCSSGFGSYTVSLDSESITGDPEFGSSESTVLGTQGEGPCVQRPSIYSRVSSGTKWIDQALQCKEIDDRGSKSGKSSKSGRFPKADKSGSNNGSTKSGKMSKARRFPQYNSKYNDTNMAMVMPMSMSMP